MIILASLILALLKCTSSLALTSPSNDPETEIAAALVNLDNLASRLETAAQLNARHGLGPQTTAANRAFSNALNFYRHKEWQSVIREINIFLNLTQVPENREYMQAQYMLGRAYEENRMDMRALRAYFRYIAAYMTNSKKDEDEFIDVLRRMVPLASRDSNSNTELRKLLSSITTLALPEAIRPEVMFIAAKSAAREGNRKLAENWLEQSLSTTTDARLKSKALYIKALLAISINDLDLAEEVLSEVITVDDGQNTSDGYNNRDLARLAIARISVRKKRYENALKIYQMIPENSLSYRDALFESVYLHLGRHQDTEARSKALLFVARYPDSHESTQIRQLLAYLDLRTGDTDAVQASINAADQQLDYIAKWMKANLSGITSIDQDLLFNFIAISKSHIRMSPSIESAQKVFARIAEVTRRLADIDGEMRDLIYTIGRANLEQINPNWANRSEQISKIVDEALTISHHLSAVEKNLYKNRLSAVAIQQLDASENRRTKLLTPAASSKRKAHFWSGLAELFEMTEKIAIEHRKLNASMADLSAAKYLIDKTKNTGQISIREKRVEELESQILKAKKATSLTLNRLRKAKLEYLIQQSPHHATKKFLAQYATALHEEHGILQTLRNSPTNTSERLLAEDSSKAWKQWHFIVDRLFEELDDLDNDIRSSVKKTLSELESQENQHRNLSKQLADARENLEKTLAGSISMIVDQYTTQIDERQSKHQKWASDIEWLRYQSSELQASKIDEQFNLETQLLRDNLTDLEQGVLWQWPD